MEAALTIWVVLVARWLLWTTLAVVMVAFACSGALRGSNLDHQWAGHRRVYEQPSSWHNDR